MRSFRVSMVELNLQNIPCELTGVVHVSVVSINMTDCVIDPVLTIG